ncbi:hypothetical protein [Amycolatopsis nigrescens]|uniref:hypothetical protein n=1 Tax=Amycolatopsis nigrescens TaxID=381445 RepID=UPI0003753CE7|nr:hypothetical protein [Amycolatopsis nigrescens]
MTEFETALSPASKLNAAFLFVAAGGIIVQTAFVVPGYSSLPPGPIILACVATAVLALAPRWRWVSVLGLLAPAYVITTGIVERTSWARLRDPGDFLPFLGAVLQEVGVLFGALFGVIAVAQAYRSKTAQRPDFDKQDA